ncbi:NAD(P)/FAD-dependent oxidoreductase [Tenacibaculum sp. IB213877]|uniref:NAD(P)/FAD-dependent oxidoreductase n=1 Tax=Tenacibaculum sp. IB213877 TaxID=3097351 RepID=UPI002A5988A8|nr:NAD(P)/FAD-dependent oxidoreductase [Tenacibaculum sp. IB213877]MDY0779431.1 NAD(P)/FAD-dependent oxidoreductase [Tenacibaculum sp. IB213877]
MKAINIFDVIIIGGSYAGLSSALILGRSLRNVLVIDSGKPCNRQTPHSHNFLTQDGKTPKEISTIAKKQVKKYKTVHFYDGIAVNGKKNNAGFKIETESGDIFYSKKLIFATGIKDIMPDIKGFSECWGISVIHCPYCHGYEFHGKKTGIMSNGDHAIHMASLVNNLTKHSTLFTQGKADFNTEQISKLNKHHIKIQEEEITEIEHTNGYLTNVILTNGEKLTLDAMYAHVPFSQHCTIPQKLGCELTESGHIKINEFQQTTIHGIYACGDNTTLMRSVANAVFGGNVAGAMVNKELTDEQF